MAAPKPPDLSHVRNIGIAAHVDAGKTTLTERILFYTKAIHKIGEVHEQDAHMDYMAEEKAHGITITAAVTKAPWNGHLIQVIDTPGHVDFTIEVERSMRVLDGAVIVMDGVRGVEPQTETVWRQRTKNKVPALFFVNKMDRPGSDFRRAMQTIRDRLKVEPVPVMVPLGRGELLDLVEKQIIRFEGDNGENVVRRPATDDEVDAELRESMLLAAAEVDEALAELVLGGEEPPPELVWAALRKGTIALKFHPCYGGTALRNVGVQPLLDGVIKLLPSPLERPPATGLANDGSEVLVAMDPDGPFAALAFKVQMWEGRRHVFARIYRGRIESGQEVAIPGATGKAAQERVARVFDVDADKKTKTDIAWAGEIALFAGLRFATTGDTLCDPKSPVLLQRIEARQPVLGLAIEAESAKDEEKLVEALDKLQQEDPTLRFEENKETGQRVLRGMGELHLQITFERLEREHGLKLRVGRPDVVLKESISTSAKGEALFHRLIEGDNGTIEMKAGAKVTVEPTERGSGTVIVSKPVIKASGGAPPILTPAQLEAAEAGAKDAASTGPVESAPMQDVKVTVEEIEVFPIISTPQAIRVAVAEAARKAVAAAGPVVLRPIMRTEVVVPEDNLGAVLGDLQSRHAVIHETGTEGDSASIRCDCALDRLLGYTTQLRSMTKGRGQFTMEFDRFDVL